MKKRLFFNRVDVNRARFGVNQRIKNATTVFSDPAKTTRTVCNNTPAWTKDTIDLFIIQLKIITGLMKDIFRKDDRQNA